MYKTDITFLHIFGLRVVGSVDKETAYITHRYEGMAVFWNIQYRQR
jgi:hypothetical protein